jgi:thioredoxin-like negative regulator of GroEL
MATAEASVVRERALQPKLVFFTSARSGHCRRVEGFLAQVLQRRRNHRTFRLHVVDEDAHPELVEQFRIDVVPTIVVVEGRKERARLERPLGCRDIEALLGPWLR